MLVPLSLDESCDCSIGALLIGMALSTANLVEIFVQGSVLSCFEQVVFLGADSCITLQQW